MTRPPRILLFADSGARVGGGHVLRCLTLARALAARGAACAVFAPPTAQGVLRAFGAGIEVLPAPDAPLAETIAALGQAAEAWRPRWLVLDHYGLNRSHEQALRAAGRWLLVIDDLAEREHDCDLLLDPSYGREAADYAGLTPPDAQILAGPQFALVRPEFAAAREAAFANRDDAPRHVLISLGLTDLDAITARTVEVLAPTLGDLRLDVVLGAGAPSLARLRTLNDPRVTVHVDTQDMAALMARADLAIGAGGSSAWERACLGLPAVTLILADNQRALARRMDDNGLTLAVEAFAPGFEGRLAGAFERLTHDSDLRHAMAVRLQALCNGLGAARVAQEIIQRG